MALPDTPQLTDYPAAVGVALGVLFTAILLVVSGRFDPTSGVLTLSILVVLSFIGIVMVSLLFRDPRRRDERGGGWRHDGGVRRDRGLLARPRERQLMSLGFILLIVLIVILIGGVGPGFYAGSPWPYGYGAGHYGIGDRRRHPDRHSDPGGDRGAYDRLLGLRRPDQGVPEPAGLVRDLLVQGFVRMSEQKFNQELRIGWMIQTERWR